jgi:hypothetical protein
MRKYPSGIQNRHLIGIQERIKKLESGHYKLPVQLQLRVLLLEYPPQFVIQCLNPDLPEVVCATWSAQATQDEVGCRDGSRGESFGHLVDGGPAAAMITADRADPHVPVLW